MGIKIKENRNRIIIIRLIIQIIRKIIRKRNFGGIEDDFRV
jgi:hypothetical protein